MKCPSVVRLTGGNLILNALSLGCFCTLNHNALLQGRHTFAHTIRYYSRLVPLLFIGPHPIRKPSVARHGIPRNFVFISYLLARLSISWSLFSFLCRWQSNLNQVFSFLFHGHRRHHNQRLSRHHTRAFLTTPKNQSWQSQSIFSWFSRCVVVACCRALAPTLNLGGFIIVYSPARSIVILAQHTSNRGSGIMVRFPNIIS